ncbi:MbtH family protein [Streptomyces sp. NPDC051218]|uniref:MbtH family protein n=1 Tax=Streptomyces sp. NPDC051218 TaxID=3365645 RepID=UPI0037A2BFFB
MENNATNGSTDLHKVVVNVEEQYSVWPVGRELPAGWHEEGFTGELEKCLDHIDQVWTDMRPLSLRQRMEADTATGR